MTGFNDAFDNTVWDPIDHEQAIKDPLHGPSALASLAEIPPMSVGDGLFVRYSRLLPFIQLAKIFSQIKNRSRGLFDMMGV